MQLSELLLMVIRFPYYRNLSLPHIEVYPFDIMVIPEYKCNGRGDFNDHFIHFLCFKIYQRTLNKKGKEGRKYRAELKKNGAIS